MVLARLLFHHLLPCCPGVLVQVTETEAVVHDPGTSTAQADGSGGGGDAAAAAAAGGSGRVVRPIGSGCITDWDVLEGCIDHVLYERVRGGGKGERLGMGRGERAQAPLVA